jgi:hypothetical protein
MRYKIQYECMDKECNTVILGPENRLDGIKCPRCDGPVMPKPFRPIKKINEDAFYVRRKIIEHCHKHCFDLTPEQVDTVLEIYKSKKANKMTIKVEAIGLDKVKEVFQVLRDVACDDRVPVQVREEIKDKVNTILESEEEC